MRATSSSATNTRRLVVGLVGLAVGLLVVAIGLNALSSSDAPPPDQPRIQTGSLPSSPGTGTRP